MNAKIMEQFIKDTDRVDPDSLASLMEYAPFKTHDGTKHFTARLKDRVPSKRSIIWKSVVWAFRYSFGSPSNYGGFRNRIGLLKTVVRHCKQDLARRELAIKTI